MVTCKTGVWIITGKTIIRALLASKCLLIWVVPLRTGTITKIIDSFKEITLAHSTKRTVLAGLASCGTQYACSR